MDAINPQTIDGFFSNFDYILFALHPYEGDHFPTLYSYIMRRMRLIRVFSS